MKDEYKTSHPNLYFTLKELINIKKLKIFWDDNEDLELLDYLINYSKNKEEIQKTYKFKRNKGFTQELKNQCKERDNFKCVKCNSTEKLEVDHIKELIDGGDNSIKNLQTLCKKCHREKTNIESKNRKIWN